jgi:hypothetical protein
MKIIGFAQLRNELEKGNLENWFRCMSVCDYIYIFDQNSTDGSQEYYKKFDNVSVIESNENKFSKEIVCKNELLTKLLKEHPDTDWILWLDGDSLLDGRLLENDGKLFKDLCRQGSFEKTDALIFGHYNLWRSDIHYRIDDQYHSLHGNLVALWRNTGNLSFPSQPGLHQKQYPDGLTSAVRTNYSVIHRGFATDYQIITRYDTYKSNGQNGWALERLLNEDGLQTELLPSDTLPKWFEVTNSKNPIEFEKIRDIYNKKQNN